MEGRIYFALLRNALLFNYMSHTASVLNIGIISKKLPKKTNIEYLILKNPIVTL